MMLGYDLLKLYIDNESELRRFENNYNLYREEVYQSTTAGIDTVAGFYSRQGLSVEDAVLDLIEYEEIHLKKYKQHYQTRELLNELVQTLDDRQKEVYNAVVWHKPTKIEESEAVTVANQMTRDFCNYIVEHHL